MVLAGRSLYQSGLPGRRANEMTLADYCVRAGAQRELSAERRQKRKRRTTHAQLYFVMPKMQICAKCSRTSISDDKLREADMDAFSKPRSTGASGAFGIVPTSVKIRQAVFVVSRVVNQDRVQNVLRRLQNWKWSGPYRWPASPATIAPGVWLAVRSGSLGTTRLCSCRPRIE